MIRISREGFGGFGVYIDRMSIDRSPKRQQACYGHWQSLCVLLPQQVWENARLSF